MQDKYSKFSTHEKSRRNSQWNYASKAFYFVTICTKDMECFFGEVMEGKMILNNPGEIVQENISQIDQKFPEFKTHEFIIMPNHLHLIIEKKCSDGIDAIVSSESNKKFTPAVHDGINAAATKNIMQSRHIGRIIQWLKARSTHQIRKSVPHFYWQINYHEKIIPDKKLFCIIQNYIKTNPQKWDEDKFNPKYWND